MDIEYKSVVENYRERIGRLALFDPLYSLSKKKTMDKSNKEVDYFGLGMLSLLFFFENMLMRNKKTGVKELAEFLHVNTVEFINLDEQGFEKVARTIIEIFRPASGKRSSKSFFYYETKSIDNVQYSILKAGRADLQSNVQYYVLDEQGLELIFATKEYFNEFQLSINQLVLRKQLEKGEFAGALRQINEMSLDVKNLQDRIIKIKHEVNRNIISNETYDRYKNIIEDINNRLTHENEEFDELRQFVHETKEKVAAEKTRDEDKKAYTLILRIDKELGQVHYDHSMLLKESIVLKTSALEAAQECLYYAGIDSFNFNNEITARVFSSPLPLHSIRTIINPFLYLERKKSWSPLTVFSPQRIENIGRSDKAENFMEVDEKYKDDNDFIMLSKQFFKFGEIIFEALGEDKKITLENLIMYIQDKNKDVLYMRSFYDLWMILHQKSPIILEDNDESEEDLLSKFYSVFKDKCRILSIEERKGIIKANNRFEIKNMIFRMEDE